MSVNSLDVVIGAGSAIGRALIERWSREGTQPILAVARSVDSLAAIEPLGVQTHLCGYSEVALAALAALSDRHFRKACHRAESALSTVRALQVEAYAAALSLIHI